MIGDVVTVLWTAIGVIVLAFLAVAVVALVCFFVAAAVHDFRVFHSSLPDRARVAGRAHRLRARARRGRR